MGVCREQPGPRAQARLLVSDGLLQRRVRSVLPPGLGARALQLLPQQLGLRLRRRRLLLRRGQLRGGCGDARRALLRRSGGLARSGELRGELGALRGGGGSAAVGVARLLQLRPSRARTKRNPPPLRRFLISAHTVSERVQTCAAKSRTASTSSCAMSRVRVSFSAAHSARMALSSARSSSASCVGEV